MNAFSNQERAATLAHYTREGAIARQVIAQKSGEPVQWKSATMDGAILDGWIDGDGETELHAHFGCVGGQVWLESIKLAGVELSEHLTPETQAVLVHEALNSLRGGR